MDLRDCPQEARASGDGRVGTHTRGRNGGRVHLEYQRVVGHENSIDPTCRSEESSGRKRPRGDGFRAGRV